METATSSRLPLLAAVLAVVLVGCSRPQPVAEPVRAVKVMTVGASSLLARHEFAGDVRPRTESRLGFRVGGKITQRHADIGQHVQAGTVLAQLDPQDFRLAADAARAQVAAAMTQRDLAAADFRRFQTLREQNFISGAELERRESTLKAAQAQLEQAQAQLAAQGNQARYTSLVADVSGVVTAVEAEAGQVVAAGAPVVRIAADGPRDVVFAVPEDQLAGVRPGTDVSVRAWASAARWQGRIREVAASADPVTRTFGVKVSLAGAQQPPLGSTVTVVPQVPGLAAVQVIKVPTSAVRKDGQGSAVWVLDRQTMTLRSQLVQVATADGNEAVVSAGLQPGMTIVTAGVHVLSPGQKVSVWREKVSTAPDFATQQPGQPEAGAAQAATLTSTR